MRASLLLLGFFFAMNLSAQSVSVSGQITDAKSGNALPFVNVLLNTAGDTSFIKGTITNEEGRFTLKDLSPGDYILGINFIGYAPANKALFVGHLSSFLDIGTIALEENTELLNEVTISARKEEVGGALDKKSFSMADNLGQEGGSVLQSLQRLPGVTLQDGKVLLRGNDQVMILIDGQQTAITGFGSQDGLDNIPASAIEQIEIINNPNSKYDANGNAGIINIIYKKNTQTGLNGKVGFSGGLGALWLRKENLPSIRPQYVRTPKVNPTLSLNYKKNKVNLFFQGDYLYTETLNKNEFVDRNYTDGTVIRQQSKRNRNTAFTTLKPGVDWNLNQQNTLTISGLFGSEKIIDRGDQPFFNADLSERLRLWQFLEDEVKTTVVASLDFLHKYKQPGHELHLAYNYTFHREDEQYFFDNILPTFSGEDAFKLLSDEHVSDFMLDYIKPMKFGRLESGVKLRRRTIPTNMQFFPGINSPLDTNAGGWAEYQELIPALYGNYVYERPKFEAEIGLRLEYVDLQYKVNPDHNTYQSDGYAYAQPFPNARVSFKLNANNKISLFYNRRVDRPNEVDIRIFPKYDDAEIIKVGNPALRPQFTNKFEIGYKTSWNSGYFYSALFHWFADGTITRISTTVPGSNLIYAIFQNVNGSRSTGTEILFSQKITNWYSFDLNLSAYQNTIDQFTVENLYPVPHTFTADKQTITSGNVKMNNVFQFANGLRGQVTAIYLAPDVIPQGTIAARFSMDLGIKKSLQNGRSELFLNASDLFNTLRIQKEIQGSNFSYTSTNYYETQVIRLGYNVKF
ncbi:MAG: outer membrane beta-barrel protein [Saprospiraceae bacterium]